MQGERFRQRIAEVREAMNRLASGLSVKRIELAGLRDQRAAFGPVTRARRDPDAPRHFTFLDAVAEALYNVAVTMGVKAVWRAIFKRGLWPSPNEGKTPNAIPARRHHVGCGREGLGARFAKAGDCFRTVLC